ncbi:MAG: M28 family peptidase [Massilia sp.]
MFDESTWPARPGPAGVAATLATIALLAWLALRSDPLPEPLPPSAPQPAFSAARAYVHVQALAREPRPIASTANAKARQYIVDQLRAAGLEPQVQTATVRNVAIDWLANTQVTLGVVHNIVARKAGAATDRASRPALLVAAHYDSGAGTLGAADGAASAAAMLETLRALNAAPPLANDVLFLFSDGEQAGSLGAMGFVDEHPWARRVGLGLQFDHSGNRGPLVLYRASNGDGDAVAGWAKSGGHHGSSLMAEVYQARYGAPSAGPLDKLGVPVLHFASTEGRLGPNGAYDTPARLHQATLQHEGDTMLALLKHFGNARLAREEKASGQVYFTLPFVGVVHYPMALVWPFTRLACLLMVGVCVLAIQRAGVAPVDITHAAFGFMLAAAAPMLTAYLLWQSLPALQRNYSLDALNGGHGAHWHLLAFTSIAAGLFVYLQRRLRHAVGTPAAALGVMCFTTMALVMASALAPGASYVLLWPLLATQAAFAALLSRRVTVLTRGHALPVIVAGAAPAVLLIAPAVRDLFDAFSPNRMILPLALFAVLLGLAVLLLAAVARRFVVRTLVVAGAGCLGIAHSASPPEPALPQPNPLVYFKDTPTWQSIWLMPEGPLDAWTRRVFPNTMHPYVLPYMFGPASDPVWYAAAPRNDSIAYPYLQVQKLDDSDGRHVEFQLVSKNRAPKITLRIDGGEPLRTSVNGRVLTGAKVRGWSLTMYGMEDQRLNFVFDMAGEPGFMVYVQEQIPGLPERDLPPRPSGMKPDLLPKTGTTIAADILRFP